MVATIRQRTAEWNATLKSINLSTVSISYADGKRINDEIAVAGMDLNTASLLSERIVKSGSVADEVNLMAVLKEIYGVMNDIAGQLLDATVTDDASEKQLANWGMSLSNTANGSVNKLSNETYAFVWARADRIDRDHCDSLTDR